MMVLQGIFRSFLLTRSNLRNYSMISMAMLFWGFSFVFVKVVFKYVGPVTMIFFRLIAGAILLILIHMVTKKRIRIEKKDFLTFFLMGFTDPFLYFIGEAHGMQLVTPTQSSVLIGTIPVFSMFASMIVFKDRVSLFNIIGAFISFLGIVVFIGIKGIMEPGAVKGFLLIFLAVFSALINSLLVYKVGERYTSLTIITIQNFIGILLFLPLFYFREYRFLDTSLFNSEFYLTMIFLSLFPSVISFIIYIDIQQKIGISRASSFTNLIPVITGISSFFILGTRFSSTEIFGVLLVISGLFMTQRRREIPYES